jgi:hypothetical protein
MNENFTGKYSELEWFLLYCVVICQHLSLSTYKQKTTFKNKVVDDKNSVVYYYKNNKNKNKNKKALIFITGGSKLNFTYFIKKLTDDFIEYENIDVEYDLYIYENTSELNFKCIRYISNWIEKDIYDTYDNITMCGLSNGGCISSHVLHNIIKHKNNKCQNDKILKLITIDSLFNMFKFLKHYQNNVLYRQDIIACYMSTFMNRLGHTHLYYKLDFTDPFKNTNMATALKYFKRMYNLNETKLEKITTMKLDICKYCEIINIYSTNDPIIQRYPHKKHYDSLLKDIDESSQQNIKNIDFNMVSHNSQMATDYTSRQFCRLLKSCLHS